MKMKRYLIMCLAALMTVGLASCDKDNDNNDNNGGNGNNTTSLVNTYWYRVDGNHGSCL